MHVEALRLSRRTTRKPSSRSPRFTIRSAVTKRYSTHIGKRLRLHPRTQRPLSPLGARCCVSTNEMPRATPFAKRSCCVHKMPTRARFLSSCIPRLGRMRRSLRRAKNFSRRTETHDYPVTVLQHLVVNTVYENGLGSSFNQIAAQVNDADGTRRFRTYSIQFDPESQRVDVRLARVTRRTVKCCRPIRASCSRWVSLGTASTTTRSRRSLSFPILTLATWLSFDAFHRRHLASQRLRRLLR